MEGNEIVTKYPVNRKANGMEASLESDGKMNKSEEPMMRTRKDVLENLLDLDINISKEKTIITFLCMFFLYIIGSTIIRELTNEGSLEQKLASFILIAFAVVFMSFRNYKYYKILSFRWQNGNYESSESIEELEKREKILKTRGRHLSYFNYLLTGLFVLWNRYHANSTETTDVPAI